MKPTPMARRTSVEPATRMRKSSSTDALSRISSMENIVAIATKMKKISSNEMIYYGFQSIVTGDAGVVGACILSYAASNIRMAKRRPDMLLNPRKLTPMVVGIVANSDIAARYTDHIADHTLHLASHVVLESLKLALTLV